MNRLNTILIYFAGAVAGGIVMFWFWAGFIVLFNYDKDTAIGAVVLGVILGLATVREARKPKPLWRQYMDDHEL